MQIDIFKEILVPVVGGLGLIEAVRGVISASSKPAILLFDLCSTRSIVKKLRPYQEKMDIPTLLKMRVNKIAGSI